MSYLTRRTPDTAVGTSRDPLAAQSPQECGLCPTIPENDTRA